MYSLPVVLTAALATVAVAVPTTLDARAANTCDVSLLGGDYCHIQGCKTGFSSYVIEFDVSTQTNAENACMRECLRNPDCEASYLSDDKKCRLFNVPLTSSTFTPGTACSGIWNQASCAKLAGLCPVAQGGFENFVKTDGYINPWSKQGTDSIGSSVNLLSSQQGGYSLNPEGARFTDFSLVNQVAVTSIGQNIRLKPGKVAKVSYAYNFNGVTTPSGSVPTAYTIEVSYCGKVLNTRTIPTTADKNVWQTVKFQFTPAKTCQDSQKRFSIVTKPVNPPTNSKGYIAHIGLDAVTLV